MSNKVNRCKITTFFIYIYLCRIKVFKPHRLKTFSPLVCSLLHHTMMSFYKLIYSCDDFLEIAFFRRAIKVDRMR